jgi:hypothetical protein
MKNLCISTLFILALACNKKSGQIVDNQQVTSSDTMLLFVGNSLTFANDLPQLVVDFAASKGSKIKADMLALPNYALVDHLADGNLQTMIANKKYKYVIVQQGPSSQAEGRAMLLESTPIIKDLCDKNGGKLAVYMVWPAYANYSTFDGVIRNYTDAATATKSILCPVGKVWKTYIDSTRDLSYYGSDRFHPSLKGSQVAAEVIYQSIFK